VSVGHLLLPAIPALLLLGCRAPKELPGPAINLHQFVPKGTPREFGHRHGDMELYLTQDQPSYTFWNDMPADTNPWGTITLKDVAADGIVVVDFCGQALRARPGRTFPGTGVKVIASNPIMKTALLRTRWTQTIMEEPGPYPQSAPTTQKRSGN
jgi:hypothetical protein